jgi:hypothetical protein
VPFEIVEFVLGEQLDSHLIASGPVAFFPGVELSPDGYRAVHWVWQDNTSATTFNVVMTSPDAAPQLIASVDVPGGGISPFVQWADDTHITYGFTDANNDNWVTWWRADLCGEIIELEPYQAAVPSMQ